MPSGDRKPVARNRNGNSPQPTPPNPQTPLFLAPHILVLDRTFHVVVHAACSFSLSSSSSSSSSSSAAASPVPLRPSADLYTHAYASLFSLTKLTHSYSLTFNHSHSPRLHIRTLTHSKHTHTHILGRLSKVCSQLCGANRRAMGAASSGQPFRR